MVMLIPLMALSLGALFSGYIFKDLFIGLSSKFWQDSIFFLNLKDEHTVPLWFLLTTPILVTTAIPVSYFYFIKKREILVSFKKTNYPLYNFLLNKWYIDELYESSNSSAYKKDWIFFLEKRGRWSNRQIWT